MSTTDEQGTDARPPDTAERVAAALRFAALGCRIAPAAGKHPGAYLGNGWQRQATCDPGLIERWWLAYTRANVAIISDRALLPLDVDDPPSFERFQAEHGPAPRTPRYLTGGDGGRERLLFKFPGDQALERIGRKLCDGVQLRHSNTSALVCIVPPGRNPDTGRKLEWLIGLDELLAPIPPAWLEHIRSRPAATPSDPSRWVTIATGDYHAGSGKTHPDVLAFAAYLMRRLRSGALVLELLLGWNERHCHPPKPAHEIESIVAWVAEKEAQR